MSAPVFPAIRQYWSLSPSNYLPPKYWSLSPSNYLPPEYWSLSPSNYLPPEYWSLSPFNYLPPDCTVLYCTVLYCTILHCTLLYCTVLYCTVLYCTALYCTVSYCEVQYESSTQVYAISDVPASLHIQLAGLFSSLLLFLPPTSCSAVCSLSPSSIPHSSSRFRLPSSIGIQQKLKKLPLEGAVSLF